MGVVNKVIDRIRLLISAKKRKCKIKDAFHINNVELEGNNIIGKSHIDNASIGRYTYIGNGCTILSTQIGRYCSLGSNIRIVNGEHPTHSFVSTHPIFYSNRLNFGTKFIPECRFKEHKYADESSKKFVVIENDVWIADNSLIIEGVRIGHGAIVAAGSVVTHDVPPYAIVGGVPARVIKYRFTEDEIAYLLEMKWWDKGDAWIKENALRFSDIRNFIS